MGDKDKQKIIFMKMWKKSAFFTLLIIALIQKASLGCFLYDIDYKGTNLKAENLAMANEKGLISGPKNCGREECCDSFKIETVGGGNFYQEERLGNYFKIGNSEDGRNVYRQQNGDNYLYYVQDRSYWMIGKNIGQDKGGVRNRGTSYCPEDSTNLWEYWEDWREEWVEDSWMEVTCDNDDNNDDEGPGGCATGSVCDDCSNWAMVNDVKYCCATNCDYGYVEVSSVNGVAICNCYQK